MALTTNLNHSSTSSTTAEYYARRTRSPSPQTLASCYTVDASTMQLQGFHYSTTGAGGAGWYS